MSETASHQEWERVKDKVHLVSGWVHPNLAEGIGQHLGISVKPVHLKFHPNGELYVRHQATLRGQHVYVVQPHKEIENADGSGRHLSIDGAIRQQRLMAVAARDAGAKSVWIVAPHLGYSRQDRKAKPREPIASAQIIRDFQHDRVNGIITMGIHSGQSQGVFEGPFDNMHTDDLMRAKVLEIIGDRAGDDFILMGPDAGAAKRVERIAGPLGIDVGYVNKRRDDEGNVEGSKVLGEVASRTVIFIDDMIDTGGTQTRAAEVVDKKRALDIVVMADHGIFSGEAPTILNDSPISEIFVTDTLPQDGNRARIKKLGVIPIAGLIGDTIRRIQTDESVSQFDE